MDPSQGNPSPSPTQEHFIPASVGTSPILVTGSIRSGTTWVGRVLSFCPDVGYIYESLNSRLYPDWLSVPLPYVYTYMSEENGHLYERAIHELLRFRYPVHNIVDASGLGHVLHMLDQYRLSLWYRLRKRRPLLKDPKGVLSAEWLNQRFDIQPVVMIRHPAAFVSSIKRLGWSFDFRNWYDQPLLMRDLLGEYRAPIKDLSEKPRDIIEQGILIWNVLHRVIDGFRHRHPDWIFLRHEDLSEEPLEGFRDLYKRLDLTWDDVVEDAIIRSSTDKRRKEVPTYLAATVIRDSRAARWTWTSRLTKKEQNRVREGTADVARLFYTDEDWTPPTEFR